MTKTESKEQIRLFSILVKKSNINVVSCVECGSYFLYEIDVNDMSSSLTCPHCLMCDDVGNFSDLIDFIASVDENAR